MKLPAFVQRYAYFLSGTVASLFIIGTVYAMATIPAGCATPGDCDEISPAFQSATLEADLIMADDDASNTLTITTPADITADFSLTLPGDDGTAGQKLVTDGSGVLTWETDSTTSVALHYASGGSSTQNVLMQFATTSQGGTYNTYDLSALTLSYDPSGLFNTTDNTITIINTGVYEVLVSPVNSDAGIFVNGVSVAGNDNSGLNSSNVVWQGSLSTGDKVDFAAADTQPNDRASTFSIKQLPTTAGVGVGGGGSSDFDGLTDTDVTGVVAGAMLYYDGSDWVDVGIGGAGQRLAVNSAGDAPEWVTDSAQVVGEYLQDVSVSNTNVLPASLSPVDFENFAEPIDTGGIVSYNAITDEYTVTAGSNPVRGEAIIQTLGTGNHSENLFFRDTVDATGTLFGDGTKRGAAQRGNYGQASGNQMATVYVPAGTTVTLNLMHNPSASSQLVQEGSYVHFRELVTGASGGGGSSDFDGLTDTDVTGVAAGAMLYYDGSDWVDVGIGTAGQQLVVNAGATAPEWASGSATEDVEVLLDSDILSSGGTLTLPADLSDYEYVRFETPGISDGANSVSLSSVIDASQIGSKRVILYGDDTDFAGFDTDVAGTTATLSLSGSFTGSATFRAIGVKGQKTVIAPADAVVNDQSASGYMDIGNVRMQWGQGSTPVGGAATTVTLPAPFADNQYTATASSDGTTYYVRVAGYTTTAFDVQVLQPDPVLGVQGNFRWQAIGLKP